MNVRWLWNPCARQARQLSLRAAGLLEHAEHGPLDAHLARCPACRARLESTRRLTDGLGTMAHALPQAEVPASLRPRWQNAVRQEMLAPAESPRTSRPGRPDQSAAGGTLEASSTLAALVARLLGGGKLTWGMVAACWVLALGFRVSAPQSPRPAVAVAPLSLKQVLMVLRKDGWPEVASPVGAPATPPAPPSSGPRSRWMGPARPT